MNELPSQPIEPAVNAASDDDAPSIAGIRRDLKKLPLVRMLATALLLVMALLLARFSWQLPISRGFDVQTQRATYHWPPRAGEPRGVLPIAIDAERALYDSRAYHAAQARKTAEDKRIVMIIYDQQTLEATAKRSPVDRAILAKALANIDRMGAKAIGIDILIDQPQPEDPQLVAAFKAMKTPVQLAYTTNAANDTDMEFWQQQFLDNWFAALKGSNVHKASIRGEADSDNVMRQWPPRIPGLPPFMPIALTGLDRFAGYDGSLVYRAPLNAERNVFTELPIQLFADPAAAGMLADQIRGRIVLVGGDLPDVDRFATPATRVTNNTISGLEVLATETAQLLDRRLPGRVGGGMLWLLAVLVVMAGLFTALLDVRPGLAIVVILFQFVFFGAMPYLFERLGMDTYGLPAFGWLAGWSIAFAAAGSAARAVGSDEKRYAQSALGKYLPRDIARQILKDPKKLSLSGEKRPIFTLFTDIEGFTALSHILPAERIATLLNSYLDGMSNIILDHGGTIDKFVGDAVVAFWGAPIARPDDGERAAEAMLAMTRFTKSFDLADSNDAAMMGRTRVGLHFGEAVVGNFGGEGRLTYTALGDAMNCASRLEGANKYLKTVALVSDEARKEAGSVQPLLRPMGRIAVSGRATPVVVWEPVSEMAEDERLSLAQWWTRFETGDTAALDELTQFSLTRREDAALAFLVERLREAGPGGTYHLKEK